MGLSSQVREEVKVSFKWSLKLEEKDKELLRKGQIISKYAHVSITKQDTDQELWPLKHGAENERLAVWLDRSGKKLTINMNAIPTHRGGGFRVYYGFGSYNWELNCEDAQVKLKQNPGREIYGRRMSLKRGGYKSYVSTPLSVSISLGECPYKKGEKQTTCPLKVVTGTDLSL